MIQLSQPIRPTGFSLEHIPKSLATDGKIDSAPQDFTVFVSTYYTYFYSSIYPSSFLIYKKKKMSFRGINRADPKRN